jgi:hypothetical protein
MKKTFFSKWMIIFVSIFSLQISPVMAQQVVKLTFTSPYAPIFSWLKEMQDSFYFAVNKDLEASV